MSTQTTTDDGVAGLEQAVWFAVSGAPIEFIAISPVPTKFALAAC